MQLVEPITDVKKLQEMALYLYNKNKRDYIMFEMGINLGLRVSDYLGKTVGFFREACNKGYIELKQQKTKKPVRVYISEQLKKIMLEYMEDKADHNYMFTSQKASQGEQPIGREQSWRILNKAADAVGITENIGCHSMRKTFGYWHYQRNHDIRLLMEIFNHSSEEVTLRYIGITNEEMKKSMNSMDLGILF